jgi:hypothetical protein
MIKSHKKSIAIKQLLLLMLIYHIVCELGNETIKPTFIKGGLFIDYTFLAK